MENIQPVPSDGSHPLDALAQAKPTDLLLAMTFEPYRREVVEAVSYARKRGLKIIVVTDSWKSPVAADVNEVFIVPATAPHVFASVIPIAAFMEILLAFLIKQGGAEAASRIKRFHENRFELGIYWKDTD
jgi:DNA-binding MurR/RpiR family transcriptional regulator